MAINRVEEIRNLTVSASAFQVRSGKTLTTIELMNGDKHSGRDIVIRNNAELEDLINSLIQTKEWLKTQ
jgi:hypothetical protein